MTEIEQPADLNVTISEQPLAHPAGGWKLQIITRRNGYEGTRTQIEIHDGKTFWPASKDESQSSRSVLTVEVNLNETAERFGGPVRPEVSWPSTSDRRPELAYALSIALQTAYAITTNYEKRKEDSNG